MVVILIIVTIAMASVGAYLFLKIHAQSSFPPVDMHAGWGWDNLDNHSSYFISLDINLDSSFVPAGQWSWSISIKPSVYAWEIGIMGLGPGTIPLKDNLVPGGKYYVSVRHNPSGHFYLSNQLVNLPPNVQLMVTARANSDNTITLTIRHNGGDNLSISDLEVRGVIGENNEIVQIAKLNPSAGVLSAGGTMTATYPYGSDPRGKVVTVEIFHYPSRWYIFKSTTIIVQ